MSLLGRIGSGFLVLSTEVMRDLYSCSSVFEPTVAPKILAFECHNPVPLPANHQFEPHSPQFFSLWSRLLSTATAPALSCELLSKIIECVLPNAKSHAVQLSSSVSLGCEVEHV